MDDGDEQIQERRTRWRIIQPDELIATFLLPLPDPIGLEDGTIIPTFVPLDNIEIDLLQPWLNHLWFQDSAGGDYAYPCSEILGNDASHTDWSDKYALSSSIQFHQTFSDAAIRDGLEAAMNVARVVSGPHLTTEEKAEALSEQMVRHIALDHLRSAGLGAVTIAECGVGLRIAGGTLGSAGPFTFGGARENTAEPLEADEVYPDQVARWSWRFFPPDAVIDPLLVERRLRNAIAVAITDLRSIQRATVAFQREPTIISSIERLPLFVPVILRRASQIGDPTVAPEVNLMVTRGVIGSIVAPQTISTDMMVSLSDTRHRLDNGVFSAHLDLHREAMVAIDRYGDMRMGALLLGISAESLLDELILHLMWEEAKSPEHAAREWMRGLDARVRSELPSRLGGPWDMTRRNAIGVWAQEVAALRHRVVHAAYIPSRAEAEAAVRGVNRLVSHLCDRLAAQDILSKYPRTALSLACEDGLRRRNAYTRRLSELQNDRREVPWHETFVRWREAWRRTRQDIDGKPREPMLDQTRILAVRDPDRTLRWVLHDYTQHLALQVEAPGIPARILKQIHSSADSFHSLGYPLPVSTSLRDVPKPVVSQDARWTEEYHLVPMTGVMVDRSDLRQEM
ncbi:hypothetical protein [Flexivirga oryzae]|uniref:Uncharacterized protein n=1 Tax=Flexivirga oryzae TaxID=1794944 RepID=A0A839N7I3_9MICO|nr:hypothetical protein [Flexivirga oryzae]MBB2893730.1 hypothetical protein [Flexivirga oryzae]